LKDVITILVAQRSFVRFFRKGALTPLRSGRFQAEMKMQGRTSTMVQAGESSRAG